MLPATRSPSRRRADVIAALTTGASCRGLIVFSGAVVAIAAPAVTLASVEDTVDAGAVSVVAADDPSRVLTEGGSADAFTLRLPEDAVCPGDSANDDWRVQ